MSARQVGSYARKKEEEEAKRAKARAETSAALQEFAAYFDEEEEDSQDAHAPRAGDKRHRAPGSMPSSGPGTLDDGLGFRPFPKKPRINEFQPRHASNEGERARPLNLLSAEDEEEEEPRIDNSTANRSAKQAASRPTIQLQSLPLGVTEARVKSLVPDSINAISVRLIPPPRSTTEHADRKSVTAVVTVHADTPGRDIDDAIRALDNKYVGFGHYLKTSRGLSSTAMESRLTDPTSLHSSLLSQPFGARAIPRDPQQNLLSRAPPPSEYGAKIPPPDSYNPASRELREKDAVFQVAVVPPASLNELRAIHRTIERVLKMGPKFEALLMSRPEVQNDEKWAWIWDARSRGGVYYRSRLWSIVTGAERAGKARPWEQLPFREKPDWAFGDKDLPYEFIEQVGDIVLDSEYDTDAEEASDDEGHITNKRFDHGKVDNNKPGAEEDANLGSYLDPKQRAKLLHLLERLPTTIAKLTRGDVARVMAFAIDHANVGASEVVDLLIINVLRPFSKVKSGGGSDAEDQIDMAENGPTGLGAPTPNPDQAVQEASEQSKSDDSSARLVGLYLINDIMSASSSSGVRSAWRYRSLFEVALIKHDAFGKLGRLDRDLKMGRMTAEKFKRSVHNLLTMWQEWSFFGAQAHESFVKAFDNPPLTQEETEMEARKAEEKRVADRERAKEEARARQSMQKVRTKEKLDDPLHTSGTDSDIAQKRKESKPTPGLLADIQEKLKEEKAKAAARVTTSDTSSPQPQVTAPSKSEEVVTAKPARKERARAEDMFGDSD